MGYFVSKMKCPEVVLVAGVVSRDVLCQWESLITWAE